MSVSTIKVNRTRFAGVRTMSRTSGGVTETITINRTAPVITSDRKGASRPLLRKVVGGAAAAFSLRDLNDKAGNNKVVRVRKAYALQQDFSAKEVVNGTLTDWVGAGNIGYVAIWYDQSGNGNHAIQPTGWRQPRIVVGGSLVKDSRNNPSVDFVGDNMNLTSDLVASGTYSCIAYHETDYSTYLLKGDANSPRVRVGQNGYQIGAFSPEVNKTFPAPSTQGLVSVIKDSSNNVGVYANGTQSSLARGNVGSGVSPFTKLAANYNDGVAKGKIIELIYYADDHLANRSAIEANIKNQYNL